MTKTSTPQIDFVFDLKPMRKHREDEESLITYVQKTEKLLRLVREEFEKPGAVVKVESESQKTQKKGVLEIISVILISIHVAILITDIPSLLLRIREGFRKEINRVKYTIKKPNGLNIIIEPDISREQFDKLLANLMEETIKFLRDTDLTTSKSKILSYIITITEDQENDKDK